MKFVSCSLAVINNDEYGWKALNKQKQKFAWIPVTLSLGYTTEEAVPYIFVTIFMYLQKYFTCFFCFKFSIQ